MIVTNHIEHKKMCAHCKRIIVNVAGKVGGLSVIEVIEAT